MDTVYRERANGRWEYWTYTEGRKYFLPEATALRWMHAGTAKMVFVK